MSLITDLREIQTDINLIRNKVGLPETANLSEIVQSVGTGNGSSQPTFYKFNSIEERDMASAGCQNGDISFVYGNMTSYISPSKQDALIYGWNLPSEITLNERPIGQSNLRLARITNGKLSTLYVNISPSFINFYLNLQDKKNYGNANQTSYTTGYVNYQYQSTINKYLITGLAQSRINDFLILGNFRTDTPFNISSSETLNIMNSPNAYKDLSFFEMKDVVGMYQLNNGIWENFDFKINVEPSNIYYDARAIASNGIIEGEKIGIEYGKLSSSIQSLNTGIEKDLSYAFSGFNNTAIGDVNIQPILNLVNSSSVNNLYRAFYYSTLLTNIQPVENWNVVNVTNMASMFHYCSNIAALNLYKWDTSNVTDLSHFAHSCNQITNAQNAFINFNTNNVTKMVNTFSSIPNMTAIRLNNWHTSNVTNMMGMFYGCGNLTSISIPNFNTANVEQMYGIFGVCNKLNAMSLWNTFDFSSMTNCGYVFANTINTGNYINFCNINSERYPKVESMEMMFSYLNQINDINLSDWDLPTLQSVYEMFYYSTAKLKNITITNWNTPNLINMKGMFQYCYNLINITMENIYAPNLSDVSYLFNGDTNMGYYNIMKFNSNNIHNMEYCYGGCNLNGVDIDFSEMNTHNLTNINNIFPYSRVAKPNSVNFANWDTSNLKDISGLFYNVENTIFDFTNWNTSNVTSFNALFYSCNNIDYFNYAMNNFDFSNGEYFNSFVSYFYPVQKFNFSEMNGHENIKNLGATMFNLASSLTDINFVGLNNCNIIGYYQFYGCTNLVNIIGFENVHFIGNSIHSIFRRCNNISSQTINDFFNLDLSNIEDFSYALAETSPASGVVNIDLSNKNFNNAKLMSYMFNRAIGLTDINFSNATLSEHIGCNRMFMGCINLRNCNLDFSNKINVYAIDYMFNGCSNLLSVDLSKFDLNNCMGMQYMFSACNNLIDANIPYTYFDHANNFSYMFANCFNLNSFNLYNIRTNSNQIVDINAMFRFANNYVTNHIEDICNFCINTNARLKLLNSSNIYSPIANTGVSINSTTVSQDILDRLTASGWTYV